MNRRLAQKMFGDFGVYLFVQLWYCLWMSTGAGGQVLPTLTSSDYEELRDDFLKINGPVLSTAAPTTEPSVIWHNDQTNWAIGHDTPEQSDTGNGGSLLDSTSNPPPVTGDEDDDDEDEDLTGAEPIGLAIPTLPSNTSYESLENVVIVSHLTTPTTGMILTEDGATILPWLVPQPSDTRPILPIHPPGTFPGALDESDTDSPLANPHGPIISLNDIATLAGLAGVNLTSLIESLSSGMSANYTNSTGSTGNRDNLLEDVPRITSEAPFFLGNDEASILILSDAVGVPVGTDRALQMEYNGTGGSRVLFPPVIPTVSVWPAFPTDFNVAPQETTAGQNDTATYDNALWFQNAVTAYSLIACGLTILGIVLCCCVYGSCCHRRKTRREYQVSQTGKDGKDVKSPLLYQI